MKLHSLILFCASAAAVFGDVIKPKQTEVFAEEGANVTLSCSFTASGVTDYLHWYRQYGRSKPEFIVLIYGSATKAVQSAIDPRFTANVTKKEHVDLLLSSAAVSDSAVYYCALQNRGGVDKLIFGKGTKLLIETKTEVKPSVYKLEDSCLATDFTKHNEFNHTESPFQKVAAVRYSGQSYYSSFNFKSDDCKEQGVCSESSGGDTDVEKDEKVNFLSLGIFWLRILFLKTVVFNVLVTFKAWMS